MFGHYPQPPRRCFVVNVVRGALDVISAALTGIYLGALPPARRRS